MTRRPQGGWVRWQRYRYQRLYAEGLAADLAHRIAAAEMNVRRSLARLIGGKQAREAELICQFDGDRVRFALTGSMNGLTEAQSDAIEVMARNAKK